MSTENNAPTSERRGRIIMYLLWLVPVGMLALVVSIGVSALKIEPPARLPGASATTGAFPRTITEPSGRQVVIPARPERVFIGEAGSADVLSEILDPKRIAAWPFTVDKWAGNQAYFAAHPEVKRFQAFNAETVLSYKPDLVLCAAFQDAGTIAAIHEAKVPMLRLEAFHSWDGIRSWIEALGAAVGEEEKAGKLIADCETRLAAVEKAVAGRAKPRVLAYSNHGGNGSAVGSGETQDEVIRRAGGINAAAETGMKGFGPFTFEQMLKLKPDVILVTGSDGLNSRGAQFLLKEPLLAELPAIKEKRIVVLPSKYYDATTQYVVYGVELLARQLHPDAFKAAPDAFTAKDGAK